VDSVLERARAVEVGPARFLAAAVLSLAALYVVVATGAVVRLTASGLGCDNWPRCGDKPFPEKGGHAIIEFGNRIVALTAMACTLLAWLAARRSTGLSPVVRRLALLVFLGTVAQVPLGGLTVIFDLHPLLVMALFLLALLVLAVAVVVALEAWSARSGRGHPIEPAWWRWFALVGVAACLVLVVTGAVVSAAGPHSGGEDIRRLGVDVRDAVYVHVRATAVFGIGLLVGGWFLLRNRAAYPGLLRLGLALLGTLGAQMAVGEIQYRNALPWWLVLLHVMLATAIWGLTVAIVHAAWRPPAPLTARA
jgi:cytochrome c oxidase assembly protein subunit 15